MYRARAPALVNDELRILHVGGPEVDDDVNHEEDVHGKLEVADALEVDGGIGVGQDDGERARCVEDEAEDKQVPPGAEARKREDDAAELVRGEELEKEG